MSEPQNVKSDLKSPKEHSRPGRSESDRKKRRRSYSSSSSSSSSSYSSSSSSSSSDRRRRHRKSKFHKHKRSRKSKRPPGVRELAAEDYFRYASEYREWLYATQGIHSSTLRTDEARAMFTDFVRAWNKGKLSARYYAGIEPTSVASSSRTEHRWHFSGIDNQRLASIRDEVNRATSAGKSTTVTTHEEDDFLDDFGPIAPSSSHLPPPVLSRSDYDREKAERERDRLQRERKEWRRQNRDLEEEMAPKATGRDRIHEKRREQNQERRAYQQSRQEDATIDPFDDRDLAKEHLAAQEAAAERRRQTKISAAEERLAAAKAKEEATMAQLRDMARKAGYGGS